MPTASPLRSGGRHAGCRRTGNTALRSAPLPARRAGNKAYLEALRAAEMAAWTQPRPGNPSRTAEPAASPRAFRLGEIKPSARGESWMMAGLFVFAAMVIAMQFQAAFGDGHFLAGLRSFVERAVL